MIADDMFTRRQFLGLTAAFARRPTPPLVLPVRIVIDTKADWSPRQIGNFWWGIWPQAVADFARGGIRIESTTVTGEVERPAFRQPIVSGLALGVLNLVVTSRIPTAWDSGRALAGVTVLYRGYHVCMIALSEAHGNQVPFLSVNTCVHEMLHALLHDIFETRPGGVHGQAREFRIDWHATCLWLLHADPALREPARSYLELLARRTGWPG
jgi:hypothetical protein